MPYKAVMLLEQEYQKQLALERAKARVNFPKIPFGTVEASKLSLNDPFMKHEPKSKEQAKLKESLVTIIQEWIPDFKAPLLDPHLENETIGFAPGNTVAFGKSPIWWYENAKDYCPEKSSRLGTKKQYDAFLGFLIKNLSRAYPVSEAWEAVCDNPRILGEPIDPRKAKYRLLTGGDRNVGIFFDIANNKKYVRDEKNETFLVMGGPFISEEYTQSLTSYLQAIPDLPYTNCVGWIVMDI